MGVSSLTVFSWIGSLLFIYIPYYLDRYISKEIEYVMAPRKGQDRAKGKQLEKHTGVLSRHLQGQLLRIKRTGQFGQICVPKWRHWRGDMVLVMWSGMMDSIHM